LTKGLLFVVSGPSGAGKGTLCQALLTRDRNLRFSVSATTRPPRSGEVDGVHYFFWSEERFAEAAGQGCFLEWARVYGHLYGTPVSEVERGLKEGVDVLLDLDIQGARQVKQEMPGAVLIFILPPSLKTLADRIARRATEVEEERRLRLEAAVGIIRAAGEFDYIVVNDDLEGAAARLGAIVVAERCRTLRLSETVSRLADTGGQE
jgi:guanylate kinase